MISQIQKQTEHALCLLGKKCPRDLSHLDVYFVSEKFIADLHGQFLNDPTPTDVITFHHGEIFVCPAVAEKQRKKTKLSLHHEVLTYVIHGILHLCGYDDHSEKDFQKMKHKQDEMIRMIACLKACEQAL